MQVSAATLGQRITIKENRITLKSVFKEIRKQSGYDFYYEGGIISKQELKDVKLNNATVDEALRAVLKDLPFTYVIVDHNVTIKKKEASFLDNLVVKFRAIDVKGKILDENGQPMVGATVGIKGKGKSVKTDQNGAFFLTNVDERDKLVISYIGYEQMEVNVAADMGNIRLTRAVDDLNEVVVIGYGTARKKDLTGAITQIKPDKIADENPRTVQDILRGTPGLTIGLDASAKNGGSINIRGQRSVYTKGNHNSPLLILDGMIFYGELSEINPDDIEQMDILKDASAAAIYGAQSANGVIIISTKRGKHGKPKINFTSNLGLSTMGANLPVWGPDGYIKYRQDWYMADTYGKNTATGNYEAYVGGSDASAIGKPGYYEKPTQDMLARYGITEATWRAYSGNNAVGSDEEIFAKRIGLGHTVLTNYLAGKTFDWYDHSFRDGTNQDYNLSVSGASDKINYYMSAGYLSNQGVIVGDNYKAIRINLKVDGIVTDWLNIGANINFQDRSDGNIATDWKSAITFNSPFAAYKDNNGNLEIYPQGATLTGLVRGYNYDYNRQFQELESGYNVLNSIFTTKVKLPLNINYSFNFSPRYQWFYKRYFTSSLHPDWRPGTKKAGVNRENNKRFDWSLNNTINWEHTFATKHRVNVTLVQEAEERQYWSDNLQAWDISPTDALGFHETKGGDKLLSEFDSDDTRQTADGMLARLFYSYDDRYMLTTSVRRDGYSAFGTSNPRATFLSAAVGWTFTNENFFKWKPLSNGKLRLSYGQNGNRSLDDPYVALANLANGTGTQGYINANGDYIQFQYLRIDRMANKNLQWEKTASFNVGLDLGFVDNRISTTLDYFQMSTTDMIMNQSLPGFSGFSSITTNLGEVQNRGFEVSVNSQNIKARNFSWNTTLGFSKYSNKIKHLYYQFVDVLDASGNVVSSKEVDDIGNKWFIGQPISSIWDYRVTGIWQVNEIDEAARYGQRPGDPKVSNNYTADDKVDANGKITPVYNDNDKQFLGQTQAPIMWSLRNDFTYKNFNFSVNIYSYWGHKSLNEAYLNQDNGTSTISQGLANTYEKPYWTIENPGDFWARLESKGPAGLNAPQRVFDRSFIRLDNVSLGYTLPRKLTSSAHIEKLKIFGSVRNLAVWNKDKNWRYWDIETGQMAPRIFSLGLNLSF
ncbi:TonB-linked outer membrane protein, SusC/RagA family [Pedobacter sp. ok626]|uniref:SusC/RagA family TonB-linked outer membrane protein n=1 Tax=Pedobacter sp. ok626 TaxID=1761882 RepID=UPI0008910BC3|nr:SusC/RagA family TonB-linked outer membrane protein [Pedobacter sp. ok626]SDJ93935.1 TonB-linked outer membrane protein, SusC/RagA family [Pedobacter sp. ok626]